MHSVHFESFGVELSNIRAARGVFTVSVSVVSDTLGAFGPVEDCESRTTANTDSDTPLNRRPETKPDWIDFLVATRLQSNLNHSQSCECDAYETGCKERNDGYLLSSAHLEVPSYSDRGCHYCCCQLVSEIWKAKHFTHKV
jgi:hypothetical protein